MDENEILQEETVEAGDMTNEETHRFDEYEGLARRVDDVLEILADMREDLYSRLDAIKAGVDGFVEAGAVIDEAAEEEEAAEEVIEDLAEAFDAYSDFSDLDFNI